MQFFEAVRLALAQIRVQKLKSFFTLLGVTIGVMFLIAVVSIVEGMGKYMQDDLIGKLIAVNTFNLRRTPDIRWANVDATRGCEWQRRPRIKEERHPPVLQALPASSTAAAISEDNLDRRRRATSRSPSRWTRRP